MEKNDWFGYFTNLPECTLSSEVVVMSPKKKNRAILADLRVYSKLGYSWLVRVLSWTILKRFKRSKAFRWLPLWVFIVPLAAKALGQLPEDISEEFKSRFWFLFVEMPFSWPLLYFSGVLVMLAGALFSVACPSIIKDYESFEDFEAENKSSQQYFAHLKQVFPHSETQSRDVLTDWEMYFTEELEPSDKLQLYSSVLVSPFFRRGGLDYQFASMKLRDGKEQEAFWYIRDLGNSRVGFWRLVCAILFGCGLLLLLPVMWDSFAFVVNSVLKSNIELLTFRNAGWFPL